MKKVTTIIRKEWAEVFKKKLILSTVIFLPLLFTAIPLAMLFFARDAGSSDLTGDIPPQFLESCQSDLSSGECVQVMMGNQFMILFMMIPLIIPVNIAAYSIVGEKTTRSLEPLLATPITTVELLIAKNLAAVIPAVLATWLAFIVYVVGAWVIVQSPNVMAALVQPSWWFVVIIVGPLLSILSVNFSLMVSSRVNDPRVAEQLSAVVILPLLAVFIGQIAGLFLVNQQLIFIMTIVLILIDSLMIYFAVRLFQRETILTRWK
jgi:ABC-2 type transport system permease protein